MSWLVSSVTVPHKNGMEPLNGVIFTLPMEKMFLAMWSFLHWQSGTSILDAHLLIIALEVGTSWIFHLSKFTLLSTEIHYIVPWITQQKSKWIVESNTNALRKISVAVGNLNHKILLNGVKNFNLGIWKIFWVWIEINEWHGATKMKTRLTKSSISSSILCPLHKWLNFVVP